ncbi:F0F1 ATP synthase subunit delta [Allorhizocola rhizosphaerae]|uniref:F0F1 ATP synthase subunit delta n=1 Tax=Allorhizocola rhizosphaerae TaxID=1872709 RepID=UPI000E3E8542|nr:F0F1 ATP synthase subunit delta [Allorhizocola rhizosphaerae]
MQAASRESYTKALDALSEGEISIGVADEILSFARLLEREPRLRRALSDPSRGGQERAELVRNLVAGKVSDDAARLLAELASGRWSTATELLDATERLGVDALLISAERAGDLAEVEDELFRFGQIVSGDTRLAATVGDSSVAVSRRVELVHQLLDGKAQSVTIKLAEIAVGGFGGRAFATALTRLVELAAERREAEIAYVTVAEPLSEAEEQRLSASLAAKYGRQVSLKITVDPQVLGGVSVRVGSDLYDGTVARRLSTVRNALAAQ